MRRWRPRFAERVGNGAAAAVGWAAPNRYERLRRDANSRMHNAHFVP